MRAAPTQPVTGGIDVPADGVQLHGDLSLPAGAESLVLFAHGSGSSRLSPRNRFVASELQRAAHATLLVDLLTSDEERADEQTAALRFDIALLARRLISIAEWLTHGGQTRDLPLGLFGASTGAAAALICAAERPARVAAVVSRGGRPDLAGEALERVQAPTLLIVGGQDPVVHRLNQEAQAHLRCTSELILVPGATHLFEEPGGLEQVARLASAWFTTHLLGGPGQTA